MTENEWTKFAAAHRWRTRRDEQGDPIAVSRRKAFAGVSLWPLRQGETGLSLIFSTKVGLRAAIARIAKIDPGNPFLAESFWRDATELNMRIPDTVATVVAKAFGITKGRQAGTYKRDV